MRMKCTERQEANQAGSPHECQRRTAALAAGGLPKTSGQHLGIGAQDTQLPSPEMQPTESHWESSL